MISKTKIEKIETHFHELLLECARQLNRPDDVILPKISHLPIPGTKYLYLVVPGMFGGFSFKFVDDNGDIKLRVMQESRMSMGGDRIWDITAKGPIVVGRTPFHDFTRR